MKTINKISIFTLLIFIAFPLISAERLFYSADRFEGKQTEKGSVKEYFGNVEMRQGDITITCDYAKLFDSTNFSIMKGNVILVQNDLTMKTEHATYDGNKKFTKTLKEVEIIDENTYLKAKRGDYNGNTNIANFYENVFIEDDSSIVNANYLKYNKKSQESYAEGNVMIKGKFNNSILLSDTLLYIPEQKYSISYGNPILFQIDSVETENDSIRFDTLSIASDTMEAFRYENDEQYHFKNNVEIFRKDVSGSSGNAKYFKDKDYFVLTEEPIIWYENTQLYGDTIRIDMKEKKLKKIKSIGTAFSISKDLEEFDEFLNQLSGSTIELFFEEGELDEIITTGNAKSLYFSMSEDSVVDAHRHDSQKIEMFFKNSELSKINFLTNVDASAIPFQDIRSNTKDYYLPRFKWTEEKPEKKNIQYKSNYFEL